MSNDEPMAGYPPEHFRFSINQLEDWFDGRKHILRPGWDFPHGFDRAKVISRLKAACFRRGGTFRHWYEMDGSVGVIMMPMWRNPSTREAVHVPPDYRRINTDLNPDGSLKRFGRPKQGAGKCPRCGRPWPEGRYQAGYPGEDAEPENHGPRPHNGYALLLVLLISLIMLTVAFTATPAYAAPNVCTVTPSPVPLGSDYSVTAQLRPAGWYSIRIDQDDHFGHHAEGAPYQADETGLFTYRANTDNGPRDSLEIGEAQVHIRPVNGTGGGGAHCRFEVVTGA